MNVTAEGDQSDPSPSTSWREEKFTQVQPHHRFTGFCTSRPRYRQGNRDTAVKVYTISSESKYLLVHNVPSVAEDFTEELRSLMETFGAVLEIERLQEYPRERFTDVFRVKFATLTAAKMAKRKADNIDFYGGHLHICYAPECESVDETREKLRSRRQWVASELKRVETDLRPKVNETSCSESPANGIGPMAPSSSLLSSPRKSRGHEAVSQASWQKLNAPPIHGSSTNNKSFPRKGTKPEERTASAGDESGARIKDLSSNEHARKYETPRKRLRLIPRSIPNNSADTEQGTSGQ